MKRLLLVVTLLAMLFGAVFGWKAYQQRQSQQARAAAPVPAVTVSSTAVRLDVWPVLINAVGSLRAFQGVDVSAEVPGTVAHISIASGQQVQQGDVLVQLDDAAERAKLRSLAAQLQLAQLDYERAIGLKQKTAVSQAQLDRAKSLMESLQAQSDEQAALIAKKSIRAPFAGELGIRLVDIGEYLSPGTAVVTLQQRNPMYVDFTLPERHLPELAVGQLVDVLVAAYPDQPFRGEITAISPKVEATTRNLELRASLSNTDLRLRPGMFAHVAVLAGEPQQVLTLPRTAINYFPYGDSVFQIEGEGADLTVNRRQVTTGPLRGGRVQILTGLRSDDLVVATGGLKLQSGQRVVIDNSLVLPERATEG